MLLYIQEFVIRSSFMKEKIKNIREKYLPYNEETQRKLALSGVIMLAWILVWALIFKCCMEESLIGNYYNLRYMTIEERIMWDIIPFNYRGEGYYKMLQIISTVLNCFVFAPFGIAFCYIFKKKNVWRDAAICLACSLTIETIQIFTTWGNPATEDLITNVAGCFIGFGIYQILFKRLSVKQNVQIFAFANIALALVTVYSLITTVNTMDLIIKMLTNTL